MSKAGSFIFALALLLVGGGGCASKEPLKTIDQPPKNPGLTLPDPEGTTKPPGGTVTEPGASGQPDAGGGANLPASEDARPADSAPVTMPPPPPPPPPPPAGHNIGTVFVVVEGGHNWSTVQQEQMPYVKELMGVGARSEQYYNPPGLYASTTNYIWLEAGATMGIEDEEEPADNLVRGGNHLTKLLDAAGISWTSYQEDIAAGECPVEGRGTYVVEHNPFVFFDDVAGDPPSLTNARCTEHHRPFSQFLPDLKAGKVARYNFISPNVLNNMIDGSPEQADAWLRANIDPIRNPLSPHHNPEVWARAALFLTWASAEDPSDGPIGMIVVSPFAKPGHADTTSPIPYHYTHSSLLRTLQEIFGVAATPLGAASSARNLSALFTKFP